MSDSEIPSASSAYSSSLIDVERDYLSMDKRYPRLFIPSEFCKAVAKEESSTFYPDSCQVEEEGAAVMKEPTTKILAEEPAISGGGNIVWNVKVGYFFDLPPCVSYSLNCPKVR
ncbi:hypothetical protein RchiOBHm_Chr3g0458311 [Rosa chinensis]|uniref:Uncharacterized protein n=1 Tax=Rosa chinensis TaxID=74649 RepID=A0A2P6R7U4_ROSCH|nr:hypothetical protein RchiOBHm_Chr3g0458311 [Rosa chinensis]